MNRILKEKLEDFTLKVKQELKSQARNFKIEKAIANGYDYATEEEKVFIMVYEFLNTHPLKDNQYYNYGLHYQQTGEKLNEDAFLYDLDILQKEYNKIDKLEVGRTRYSLKSYEDYVLYISLKVTGYYKPEYDKEFNVQYKNEGGRYYTPLTKIATVLRPYLPDEIKLIEFDIKKAFPTFIDLELGIKRTTEEYDAIYDTLDKVKFNMLLNIHKDSKKANIDNVRKQLEPIYGKRVDEVITEQRFNEKGAFSRHFEQIETKYINEFVEANLKAKNIPYARLHDGLFIKADVDTKDFVTEFGIVRFGVKECTKPTQLKEAQPTFYYYDNEGKLIINSTTILEFLEPKGFVRVDNGVTDELVVYKNDHNSFTAEEYAWRSNIASYLGKHITHEKTIKQEVQRLIAKKVNTDIKEAFITMDAYDLKYHRDDRDTFALMFKNGYFVLERGEEKPQLQPYNGEKGFFKRIDAKQNLDFEHTDEVGDMERFVHIISTGYDTVDVPKEEEKEVAETFKAFCSMIGHLAHTYKDTFYQKAIVLTDEDANGQESEGRRGKGILTKMFSYIYGSLSEDAKQSKADYNHFLSGLRNYHNLFIAQDLKSNFDWTTFYNMITDDTTINRKGIDKISVPYEESPKLLLTTNFIYAPKDESTRGRHVEYKFKKVFDADYTPKDKFKRRLFDDWDSEEWNKFYSFIYYCVSVYFEEGVYGPNYDKSADEINMMFEMDNGVRYNEVKRIWEKLKNNNSFTVTDIKNITNEVFKFEQYKPVHDNNARRVMTLFFKKEGITNVKYVKNTKTWIITRETVAKSESRQNKEKEIDFPLF